MNKTVSSNIDGSDAQTRPYSIEGLESPLIKNKAVVAALSRVPRHEFVPDDLRTEVFTDRALSIGLGQTISQPFIVALMSQAANVSQGSKVLEIGTGSGYQAAVLSELGARVYSIEIIEELSKSADLRLKRLGYEQVELKVGDGFFGWPEAGPFDAIIVTAAAPAPPPELLKQLAHRGRMVIPLEDAKEDAEVLVVIERDEDDFVTEKLADVRFVPLTGEARRKNN